MGLPASAKGQQPASTKPLHQQARRALREHDVEKAKTIANAIISSISTIPGGTAANKKTEPTHLDHLTALSILCLTADTIEEADTHAMACLDVDRASIAGVRTPEEGHSLNDAIQPCLRLLKGFWKKFDPEEEEGQCQGDGPCVCGWLGQRCPEAVYIAQGLREANNFDGTF